MALNAYSLTLGVIAINNTFLTALFNFLSRFFAALAEEQVEQEDTMASVTEVTEWTGAPPYRYIDVSRYQGNITLEGWKKVKAAGYQGVMLKTVSTNRRLSKRADGLYIDPTFETNYRNAKAAGLAVGVYYYTYATSKAMADAELSLLADALRGKTLEMPVAVDVEDNKFRVLGKQTLTDLTAYALKKVEDMGFYAQLYTYTSFAKTRLYMGGAASAPTTSGWPTTQERHLP